MGMVPPFLRLFSPLRLKRASALVHGSRDEQTNMANPLNLAHPGPLPFSFLQGSSQFLKDSIVA